MFYLNEIGPITAIRTLTNEQVSLSVVKNIQCIVDFDQLKLVNFKTKKKYYQNYANLRSFVESF